MSTLADIEGVLSDGAPYSGAITATMNALNTGLGIVNSTLINPDTTKQTNDTYAASLKNQNEIFSLPDSVDRANRLNNYFNGLCLDAGSPVGELSGIEIPVPVEVLQSLGLIANGKIRDDSQLDALNKAVVAAVSAKKD